MNSGSECAQPAAGAVGGRGREVQGCTVPAQFQPHACRLDGRASRGSALLHAQSYTALVSEYEQESAAAPELPAYDPHGGSRTTTPGLASNWILACLLFVCGHCVCAFADDHDDEYQYQYYVININILCAFLCAGRARKRTKVGDMPSPAEIRDEHSTSLRCTLRQPFLLKIFFIMAVRTSLDYDCH